MVLSKEFPGRKIIRCRVEIEGGHPELCSLFFHPSQKQASDPPAMCAGRHGNGEEFKWAAFLRPLKDTPHHCKSDGRLLFNRSKGKGQTGFEPGRDEISVGTVNGENFFTEPADEAPVGRKGLSDRNPL